MTKMLLDDLMDHAMIQNGAFQIVYEYFDLAEVIKSSFQTNKSCAQGKSITFEGPVYKNSEDAIYFKQLHGDSRRYLQILVNFVNNAVKFTNLGGEVSILTELINIVKIQHHDNRPINTFNTDGDSQRFSDVNNLLSIPDKEVVDSGSNGSSIPDKEAISDSYDHHQKQARDNKTNMN